MRANPSWKDYFVFSKKERTVVIILVIFFISYSFLLLFYHPKTETTRIENVNDAIAKLSSETIDSTASQPDLLVEESSSASSINTLSLFYFDPNTLDEAGFQKLGLQAKTIHTIINYRNKGGHFYKPDDLRKIYGLTSTQANQLVPYVKINSSKSEVNSFTNNAKFNESPATYVKEKPQIIDINTAGVEQWKALPAIGDALSNRIVKYRDKMGGFTSIEEVKKTYGLSDSAYQVILPYLRLSSSNKVAAQSPSLSQKININKATASDLKQNPSIPADVADAIIIYRKAHGNYSSVADIKKIVFITDALYQKISPFLTVE